jgi:hypothetical protein
LRRSGWFKPQEEVPVYETEVWNCVGTDCNGWMRNDYAFQQQPDCPFCGGSMTRDSRMLPELLTPTFKR